MKKNSTKSETSYMDISLNVKIILISVLGFIIIGVVGYPFQVDYDSALIISRMLSNGYPTYNNWIGWLYPSLCYWSYYFTGLPLAIGIFNSIIYWISVSLFGIALFGKKRHPLLWYAAVAFFPGSLAFMTSITNNTTLFAMTFCGISLYIYYRRSCRKIWLLVASLLLLVSTLFIRREALMYIPLIMIYICITECCSRYGKSLKTRFIGLASALAFLFFCLLVESRLTMQIPNYHVINTVGFTALFDLNGISHLKGEVVIPRHIFKEECQNDDLIKEVVLKCSGDYSNDFGEGCFWRNDKGKSLLKQNAMLTDLKIQEIVPVYLDNFKYYLLFRYNIFMSYMYTRFFTVYGYDDYLYNEEPSFIYKLFRHFALYIGIVFNSVWEAIFMLFISLKGYVKYEDRNERRICNSVWGLLIIVILFYIVAVPSIQVRYVYPPCLFIWYLGIYTASLMGKRDKSN